MSTCCEGQGTRMIGALPEFIYSLRKRVYIDLFAPSSIDLKTSSGKLTLKMETEFPYDPKVSLTVITDNPAESVIRIRIPSWSSGEMSVLVNGKKRITGKPGTYVALSQKWNNGDKITFVLPMDFRLTKYTGEEQFPDRDRYALEYGPILMAYVNMKGEKDNLTLSVDSKKLIKSLKPVRENPFISL